MFIKIVHVYLHFTVWNEVIFCSKKNNRTVLITLNCKDFFRIYKDCVRRYST